MSKQIELPKSLCALVDEEDYARLSIYTWYVRLDKDTNSFYAWRPEGKGKNRHTVYMAREVMKTPSNLICDHINHNTLDNRKENLRNVTRSQNGMNRKKANPNNRLGEKNIYCHSDGRGFQVEVSVKQQRFGHYHLTIESARAERDRLITVYHGEFGNIGESLS